MTTEGYCCFEHVLCDVEVPGEAGAAARAAFKVLAPLVAAGGVDRWCGNSNGSPGAFVLGAHVGGRK